ncbi:TIGR02466 family protein [Polymorphobacter sp.]|uniref:TIGR02466 family protein n=1 Tax=Polymorphobacter sp. TaxID=1909290 RepID=UPI003F6F3EC4
MLKSLFATRLYEARLDDAALIDDLAHSVRMLAEDDGAGRRWCRDHAYPGYTSYASLNDLPSRDPAFNALKKHLDRHAAAFAEVCHMQLARRPRLDSLWVNMLKGGGGHSGHIHPHSILSGTLYVEMPEGAAGLRLEDPRLPMLMHAPQRRDDAPDDLQTFHTLRPTPGTLYLWESWLRHEVPQSRSRGTRISISFNYD